MCVCLLDCPYIVVYCYYVWIYQVETVTDSETESKGLPQFHSIGIQVEDHKRYVAQTEQNSVHSWSWVDLELH